MNLTDATWRTRLMIALPSILAFIHLMTVDTSWINRFLGSVLVGASVWLAMFLASGLLVAWIHPTTSAHDDISGLSKQPIFIAGMVVTSLVWVWWQYDRDRVVREVARCAETSLSEGSRDPIYNAVIDCYRRRSDDLDVLEP